MSYTEASKSPTLDLRATAPGTVDVPEITGVAVLLPARNEALWIDESLEALLRSEVDLPLAVQVLSNGSTDDTVARAAAFVERFTQRGWSLEVSELGAVGKPHAIRFGSVHADPHMALLMLDMRRTVNPDTIDTLLRTLQNGTHDVVSAQLEYVIDGDWVVRRFSRCYGKSPYARSGDLKGTCVLFSPAMRAITSKMPDVAADDRYYVASVPRSRRGAIATTPIDYRFPPTARALLRQQARWVSSNRHVDAELAGYERNEHESRTERYFVDPKPPILDRVIYFGVLVAARVVARIRPTHGGRW